MDISVTLSDEKWNAFIKCAGYAPFNDAAPLIQEIMTQAREQQMRASQQAVNGAVQADAQ